MPLQVGTMMVVVRAQDFASRTLRRVGAEMNGLSRQQRIQAMREATMFQKSSALSQVAIAESNARRLAYIKEGATRQASLTAQTAAMERFVTAQRKVMQGGRFTAGIDRASIREFQNASAAIRQFGLEGVLAAKRLAAARASVTSAPKRMKKADRALMTRELVNAERAVRNLTAAQKDGVRQWDALNRQVANFDQRIQTLPASLRRAAQSQAAYGDALYKSNRALERAYKNLSDATRAEMAFNSALRQMPVQRMHDFAHALGGVGRTMQLFGAVGTAAFGLAAHSAAEYSKAVSLAATQMTDIDAPLVEAQANAARLRKEILVLAKEYTYSAKEMAAATYEIFSSTNVQNIDEGMALLEAFARVGVAGQVDLETATKASITVLNTFRGATEDVGSTLNRMFSIVRYGRMQFSDFAEMLPKVAAAAYGSGQSLDDVAGIMAFLTRKTGDAQIAATQISRAFDVFTRKEFRTGIKALGVDIETATGHLLPLPQVLNKIWDAWGKELASGGRGAERFIQIVTRASQQAGKGLMSTTEARRFFRFLFADFETYNDLQEKTVKNNSQFAKQFELMMADPGVQWDIFVARIKAGIIEIGAAAIPMFAAIGQHVADFLDWWEQLSESTRGQAVRWGVLISVFTLLSGIMLSLGGVFISVALGMGRVAGVAFRMAAAMMGLSTIIGAGGKASLIARLFVIWRMMTLLAAIGVIVIGVELEQRGGGWEILGKLLQTGGIGALLKRAGMTGLKRFPMAAVLSELIWPENVEDIVPAEKFQDLLLNMDTNLAGTMKKAKLVKTQRAALVMFQGALQKGLTFNQAKAKVLAFLKKAGVDLDAVGEKASGANKKWEDFLKGLKKVTGLAGTKKFLEALGLDEQGLAEWDDMMDQMKQATEEWGKQLAQTTEQAGEQAVDNLRNMYTQMEQVNRQAFGQLFQGPWLTSETFDLAKEWGITPQMQDIIHDLDMQINQFKQRRQMLDTLFKRGLPQGFLDELQQMTPEEAMPILQELVDATPKETRRLVQRLNAREKMIKDATKIDFTREITAFKKAGVDMGEAMINGFQNAGVGLWFDGWIKTKFPNLINAAVATAVAEWKKANPKPELPKGTIPPIQKGKGTSGKGGDNNSKTVNVTVNVRPGSIHDMGVGRQVAFATANALKGKT